MMYNNTMEDTEEVPLVSMVTIVSLLSTVVLAGTAVGFSMIFGKKLEKEDKYVLAWVVFDALIHFFLELPFVVLSLWGTVLESDHFMASLWKEYTKADYRWGVSDPTIVSLEIPTVTIVEVFAIVLVYAIIENKYYRHYIQICLCVCELYGGWMTFCPEWLTGSKNLTTDNPLYLWVYLVFFNCLWVVVPLYLLWQSWWAQHWWVMQMTESGDDVILSVKKETTVTTNTYHTYNTRSKSKKDD